MTDATTDATPSVFEDLLDVLYKPATVFERRRDTAAFGLGLLVIAIAIIVMFFAFRGIMEPVFDAEFKRGAAQAMKNNPQITAEMMQKGQEIGKKFMVLGVAFYAFIIPLLIGLILWFLGKLFGSVAEIGQMMMVSVYAMVPRVIEGVINAVQLLVLPDTAVTSRYSIMFGVGRFLDVNTVSPMVLALVGRIDVFTLWVTAILIIGLKVLGRLPALQAVIVGALIWLVGALPGVWGALRAGG